MATTFFVGVASVVAFLVIAALKPGKSLFDK